MVELTGKIEQLESQYEEISTNYNILKLEKEEQTKELEDKLVKQEAEQEEVTQSLKAQLEEVILFTVSMAYIILIFVC